MKTKTLQTRLIIALMLLGFLFISNVMMAQEKEFNCLSRGEQQLTQFFVGIDGINSNIKIINDSPYTVSFTASQRKNYSETQ